MTENTTKYKICVSMCRAFTIQLDFFEGNTAKDILERAKLHPDAPKNILFMAASKLGSLKPDYVISLDDVMEKSFCIYCMENIPKRYIRDVVRGDLKVGDTVYITESDGDLLRAIIASIDGDNCTVIFQDKTSVTISVDEIAGIPKSREDLAMIYAGETALEKKHIEMAILAHKETSTNSTL